MTNTYLNFYGVAVKHTASPNEWQQTTAPGQTLTGLVGKNNQLSDIGGSGATLIGGGGDDTFIVSSTSTNVVESEDTGIDTISAWCNFTLPTNVTNMALQGKYLTGTANGLDDLIVAVGGSDTLVGGSGDDVLVDSGAGGDVFSFSQSGGKDVLYGFKTSGTNHDIIRLSNYGITSVAQLLSGATQVGADTLLSLSPTDSLLLRNTNVASLTASDFLLQLNTSQLTMTFDGEFNSLSLYNPATGKGIWQTNFSAGYQGESGSQAYTSRTQSGGQQEIYVDPGYQGTGVATLGLDPFSISNGILTITAAKAPTADVSALNGYQYTSGLLTTAKSFSQLYGYFEMKAELPVGQGAWPCFWLLPSNGSWPPELDALESTGGNTVYQTMHTDSTGQHTYISAATTLSDVANTYHTYGVLWTATTINFYIDHIEVNSIATPSDLHTPMYMLANLALGGAWPGDVSSAFTSEQMKIAYIRAYSLNSSPVQPAAAEAAPAAVSAAKPAVASISASGRGRHTSDAGGTSVTPLASGNAHTASTLLFGQYAAGEFGASAAAADISLVGDHSAGTANNWRVVAAAHA
jgi:serralysin